MNKLRVQVEVEDRYHSPSSASLDDITIFSSSPPSSKMLLQIFNFLRTISATPTSCVSSLSLSICLAVVTATSSLVSTSLAYFHHSQLYRSRLPHRSTNEYMKAHFTSIPWCNFSPLAVAKSASVPKTQPESFRRSPMTPR